MDRKLVECFVISVMLTVTLGLSLFIPLNAAASERPILYLFWGAGCPHCEDEKAFLKMLPSRYPQLEMRWFEVWDHPDFAELAEALGKASGAKLTTVPLTFIGDRVITGFISAEDTGVQIEAQVQACLQKDCPDPLDQLGPSVLAAKIRAEAVQRAPQGWEYYPAAAQKGQASQESPAITSPPTAKVIVYYLHGAARCPSCLAIEELTQEAVIEAFRKELDSGLVEWKVLNVEEPEHQHFIKDYQLYTKSVIVSEVRAGKEQRWKNLPRVWELLHNEKDFKDYVKQEIADYLKGKQS